MSEWISVDELLPENEVEVLTYKAIDHKYHDYRCGYVVIDREGVVWCESWASDVISPTHWMPLPEAPKESTDVV